MFDFFKGKIEINYNRLPANLGVVTQDEVGWSEDYFFPVTPGVAVTRANMRNLVAARAALLPLGCYVFRAGFGKASVFKSHYSLNGFAINPVLNFNEGYSQAVEPCNEIEAGILYRFEDGAGRRWQRLITAIRDSWMTDMAFFPGAWAYDPVSAMAAPQVASTGGVRATATATLTAGAVSSLTITAPGSGYVTAPRIYVLGGGGNAYATATLSGGTVSGYTGLVGGSGYSGTPTVFIPAPQSEPWGLAEGQGANGLIENFLSCVANYCINFHSVRTPNLTFPSGKMTQGDTIPSGGTAGYVASRILYQKVSDHDRGSIHVTNRARKKARI